MHEILLAAEMRRADRLAIAAGVSGEALMEAAGRAVAEVAVGLAPPRDLTGQAPALSPGLADAAALADPAAGAPHQALTHAAGVAGIGASSDPAGLAPDIRPILVLAGPGNNGGDGYVAARLLAAAGRAVTLMALGDPAALTGDAAAARDRWPGPILPAATPLPAASLVIDALFGAGLDRPLAGRAAELVASANAGPAQILAVDLPSGLHADTGAPLGPCIEAAATVTFFRKKPCHLLYPGRALCGVLRLAGIGLPASVLADIAPATFENTPALWAAALPRLGWDAHKYHRGHTVVVSGPMTRTGAARLAAGAALRAGAGLVTLASPPGALAVNAAHLTAVMLRRIENAPGLVALLADKRFTAVALGPGLGIGADERALVHAALASEAAAVLDADALTAFAADPAELFAAIAARAAPTILTPHDGEFARLFPDLAPEPRPVRARAAAARSGAVVVLKGADTAVAAPDGRLAINANAPPWLGTAGSGDVLTGVAAALAGQGVPGWSAACAAVWMHGAAGTEAGPGLTAEDLAPALRPVLARLAAAPPA